MDTPPALKFFLVAPILVGAITFLAISALVILRGAPLVLRASHLSWTVTLAALFLIAATLIFYYETSQPGVCVLLGLPALILVVAWRAVRGYLVIAVTDQGLRAALKAALDRLGLPYEESILGFSLISLAADLQVQLNPALGTAQLQIRPGGHSGQLAQITAGMRDPLRGEAKLGAAMMYGAFGLFFLALALYQAARL